jgi:leucyl-tRNA synthetase
MPYNHQEIEPKWQKRFEESGIFHAEDGSKKDPFYCLVEFPYPSGDGLHVGHPRSYTALDVIARKRRMEGYNVLYPMGWDAFGLPTENFAIKTGRKPQEVTAENIATYKRQLKSLGISFDWEREINTTDSSYYKWTQWMFLELFKAGLAYKDTIAINWCVSCKIGLANEEVVGGACERCGGVVEKRDKEQWMIAITKYADKLLGGLKDVDYLPQIKKQQENWIGRSEGAEVVFKIDGHEDAITVFTTRPDTLFGATYMVLAPEHAFVDTIVTDEQRAAVESYVVESGKKTDIERGAEDKEKTGVFTGAYAINPVNKEKIPIWVADYVMMGYGTGAIMAVPAHDSRDHAFAKKFSLPICEVVLPSVVDEKNPPVEGKKNVERKTVQAIIYNPRTDKYLNLAWKEHPWITFVVGGVDEGEDLIDAAKREVLEETGYTDLEVKRVLGAPIRAEYFAAHKDVNRIAYATAVYLELTSDNQEPISEEEQAKHDLVWVDRKDLNRERMSCSEIVYWLDRLEDPNADAYCGEGVSVNSDFLDGLSTDEAKKKMASWLEEKGLGKEAVNFKLRDWVFSRQRYWGEPIPLISCEKCGWVPVPEDQLPLTLPEVEKYEPTDNGDSPLAAIEDWVNTKCPTCQGDAKRETDTMPNWAGSSWYFLRYIDPHNDEVFADPEKLKYWMPVNLYNGGMEHVTLHLLYSRFWNQFLHDQGHVPVSEPYQRRTTHGLIMADNGVKMSKSKGNVVNPDEMVLEYGADALRTYILFMGPFDEPVPWSTNGLVGVRRFLEKINRYVEDWSEGEDCGEIIEPALKKVGDDIEAMRFNTAVSTMMQMINALAGKPCTKKRLEKILLMLCPFAPHLANELWEQIGNEGLVEEQSWPEVDEAKLVRDVITMAVQVNGKVRAEIEIAPEASENEAKEIALASEDIQKYLEGKEIRKVIYIQGRILNIVV